MKVNGEELNFTRPMYRAYLMYKCFGSEPQPNLTEMHIICRAAELGVDVSLDMAQQLLRNYRAWLRTEAKL